MIADKPLVEYRCDKPTGRTAGPKFLFPELGTIDPKLPKAKRLERLAELVTSPEDGRLTRTIANRIWHRLMGHGIVHPVDLMGDKPWSADLLDYLGVYLSDNGYDLKKLMEHIATSRIYQSQAVPIAREVAAEDYVFRGPEIKRMTAEQFVDAIWMLTGTGADEAGRAGVDPAVPGVHTAGASIHSGHTCGLRSVDAFARPTEPRTSRHRAAGTAFDSASARSGERRNPGQDAISRRGEHSQSEPEGDGRRDRGANLHTSAWPQADERRVGGRPRTSSARSQQRTA